MKPKIIYLHVGTTKTGSTSIQMLLQENEAILRQKNFAAYTPCRQEQTDHPCRMRGLSEYLSLFSSRLPTAGKRVEWFGRFLQRLRDEPAERIIISEECLWDVIGSRRKRRRFRSFVNELQTFAEVKILVYLRRQDNYLMSTYQQNLKGGQMGGLTCRQWLRLGLARSGRARYSRCIKWLLPLVGKDNLTVRPFETAQFVQESLLADFLRCVGLDLNDGFSVPEIQRNPGLSPFLAELLRCLGFFYTEQTAIRPFLWLKWAEGGRFFQKDKEHQFLSPADRRRLMKKHEDGNRWIAKELLGRADGILFYDPLPSENGPWVEYRLNPEEVCGFFKETKGLKLSPERRAQMCRQILSILQSDDGFRRFWRTDLAVLRKRIGHKLSALSGRSCS
jgi:hypothetical protein